MSEQKSAYGSKSSDIKESPNYLGHGVNENLAIVDVSAGLKKRQKGEEEDDVCDVLFKSAAGQFQLRVFNPDKGDDAEKVAKNQKYTSDLFAYLGRKITGKDVEIPSTISSFKELTDYFIKLIGPKEGYSKLRFALKLVGNVYNGKANIQVTRYFGWLERMDSAKKPVSSPSEIAKNNEYDAFIANKTPNTSTKKEGEAEEDFQF